MSQEQIQYARMKAEMDAMKAQQETLKKEQESLKYQRDLAHAEKLVTQLNAEGYFFKEPQKEAEKLAKMTTQEQNERMDEVRLNYQRDPTAGNMLRTVTSDPKIGPDVIKPEHQERALAYMRTHGDEDDEEAWDKAVAATANK